MSEAEPAKTHPPPPRVPGRSRPGLALLFALAALAAAWNPIAAPFGLVVAIGAAVISARAVRAGTRRRLSVTALVLSLVALAVSGAILVATAGGLSTELTGARIVKGPRGAELDRVLSEAAGRTRKERERAARELGSQPARPEPGEPEHGE